MLRFQAASLPHTPGIYTFYNRSNKLIYVGKAKDIKKRVSSYFTKKSHASRRITKLVSETNRIEYTITHTEYDALLLENSLIKQNQPKYNILLKDGKTYPYLCILKERFPRIISTRKYLPHQGEYFGPYASVISMKNMLELLHRLYCLRTCNFLLSKKHIEAGKFKVCLEYHMGNCKGPCTGLQDEQEYNHDISLARSILKGNISIVNHHFTNEMRLASTALEFEKAALFKNKLTLLKKFQAKSVVVNKKTSALDVITITSSPKYSFINYMQIKEGAIILSENIEIQKKMEEIDEEILSHIVHEIQEKNPNFSSTILSNKPIAVKSSEIKNIVPRTGDKKKLVILSLKNAMYQRKIKDTEKNQREHKKEKILIRLQKDLNITTLPRIIECFDNSNFQGSFPVASMVRFVDGKPNTSNYRHYNIKTVVGPNDFESMQEVVSRRYTRLIKEKQKMPNLIIVDGGKGQLSSTYESLKKLNIHNKIPVIGIAKRLEEIYVPTGSLPLHIDKRSPGLFLIQKIRDEAHRFAVSFHRIKRNKSALTTKMESIPGIGEKTMNKLLIHFKSWEKVKKTSSEHLIKIVGAHKASLIKKKSKE